MKLIVYLRVVLILSVINCLVQFVDSFNDWRNKGICTIDLTNSRSNMCINQHYHDDDIDYEDRCHNYPDFQPHQHATQKCLLDNPSVLINLPENEKCFEIFGVCGCNSNQNYNEDAYLQFFRVTGNKQELKLNNHYRLVNFKIFPDSFRLCRNASNTRNEQCQSQFDLITYDGRNRAQTSRNFSITNTKCLDIFEEQPQGRILTINHKPINPTASISIFQQAPLQHHVTCLEVFSKKGCTGDGIRVVLPLDSFATLDKDEPVCIWEYYNDMDTDTDIKSVRMCSHCQKDNSQTSSPRTTDTTPFNFVSQTSTLTPVTAASKSTNNKKCAFPSCIQMSRFIDEKSITLFDTHKDCYFYFGDETCSTEPNIKENHFNITVLHSLINKYPAFKNWTIAIAYCSEDEKNPADCSKPKFSSFRQAIDSLMKRSDPPSQPTHTVEIIVLSVAGSLAFIMLILVIIMGVLLWRKKRRIREIMEARCFPRGRTGQQQRNLNMHQIDAIEVNDYENDVTGLRSLCASFAGGFEIPRERINIGNIRDSTACIIGVGEISIAFKGRLEPQGKIVAVKTLKSGQGTTRSIKAVLKEAQMFMQLRSQPGILEILGVCTENVKQGEVFMVMTWCENGPLRGFLAQQRSHFESLVQDGEWITGEKMQHALESKCFIEKGPPVKFNTFQLFKWCSEVVDVMEFLAVRKITHISLSSRNVLLDEKFSCKISDFHMARVSGDGIPNGAFSSMTSTTATLNRERVIPWRWCAVESLLDDVFSTQSDIWTFGVFMWEVFSLGAIPYPEYSYGSEFTLCIKHGYRLQTPDFAPIECYQLMLMCWYDAPEKRPSFSKLKLKLEEMTPRKNTRSSAGSFRNIRL